MSDLFGGQDPHPASVSIIVRPHESDGTYSIELVVAEATTRRRHRHQVDQVPHELLADVLDNAAWWAHLALVSTRGQHKGVPAKWARRTVGRLEGWRRRAR